MEKPIKDFDGYAITDDGKVISYKYKNRRVLKTYYQASGYENIKLQKNGVSVHCLVHRLVAEAFIPNPNNLPEVNHKNKNVKDNRVENLEWCDRKYNLYQSYETLSPIRNFCKCKLYREKDDYLIGEFISIAEAARYANKNFDCSESGMIRNYKSRGYYLIKESVEAKDINNN